MHEVGKSQPVHASGHLNVCKQNSYVGARLKNFNGFVRIDGLNWRIPRVLDNIDGPHSKYQLVLYHQDD